MVIADLLYVLGSRSLDDADLLAVDRDEHRQDEHEALKMVGKPGLSSISLLLIRVPVGIAPFPIVRCAPPRPL
jgi:hypothetical protein